jgi:hypothetical protein
VTGFHIIFGLTVLAVVKREKSPKSTLLASAFNSMQGDYWTIHTLAPQGEILADVVWGKKQEISNEKNGQYLKEKEERGKIFGKEMLYRQC